MKGIIFYPRTNKNNHLQAGDRLSFLENTLSLLCGKSRQKADIEAFIEVLSGSIRAGARRK
jgi:hypothetical protein